MQTVRTNLTNNASTQYANFNYNSLCRFNGVTLGAGTTGLFDTCNGTTDNSASIDAYFIPALTSLGTMNQKRLSHMYIGGEFSGNLIVQITGDETNVSPVYTLESKSTEGQQRRRLTVGRGQVWTYGSFKFSNVSGSDFSIDYVQVLTENKKHGIK